MSDRTQRNLITLLKLFKNRPYHLSKYLLDNSAFNKEFLKKIDKSFKLNELSNKYSNLDLDSFSSLTQMDDFYNSLLEEMHEIVLHDKSVDLTKSLNERLDFLIKDEKYEEAAAIRDYMVQLGIKRRPNL
jgi:hypothetical protein